MGNNEDSVVESFFKGLSDEEMNALLSVIPDIKLWEELRRRYDANSAIVGRIKNFVNGNK